MTWIPGWTAAQQSRRPRLWSLIFHLFARFTQSSNTAAAVSSSSFRAREKKKDWVRYVFLPRRPTSHYRLAARMEPRKFWCAYFSSKHWYLFQAAEGKLKTTVGSSSISFPLSFLYLIAHPKQAQSQFVALNIHFQTSNKVRFQIKGGNLKDIKCPILHRFQLFFLRLPQEFNYPPPAPQTPPLKKRTSRSPESCMFSPVITSSCWKRLFFWVFTRDFLQSGASGKT